MKTDALFHPVPLGLEPSFGFGDRTGLATPGHVRAMQAYGEGIQPIFPQQSIREMTRTGRSPEIVMRDALEGMRTAGWTGNTGADADHLKTPDDVDRTAAAGFTFFTIDPSDHVDEQADGYDEATLRRAFQSVRDEIEWFDRYCGATFKLNHGTVVDMDEEATMRAAVKYGRAINECVRLADSIRRVQESAGRPYEIELSVDETEQPTSLAEHWIIAEQCLERGMKLVSLAPRFIGRMEKGVDYIGDLTALERTLDGHVAILEKLGPYKLSLHSGSDKLSMYTAFARSTRGRFHVKTAGTSYLEALRVVAIEEPGFFRELCAFARERYDTDKATYHVHATLAGVPAPDTLPEAMDVERTYLEKWTDCIEGRGFTAAGRQILHCTFGSTLTHPEYGTRLRDCLAAHPETYAEVLEMHFGKHLQTLQAGL